MRIRYRGKRNARAEDRAQAERDAGIPDREPYIDGRPLIALDLSGNGGRHWVLEPVPGKLTYLARDVETGQAVYRLALKSLLHVLADGLPRTRRRD